MSTHVMHDIETFGQGNFAVILSIGACKFDPAGDTISDRFQVFVNPESCQRLGLRMDADTIMWWMDPKQDEVRVKLMAVDPRDRLPIVDVLAGYAHWYGQTPLPTWGNGSDFDNVILTNAYKLAGIDCPWKFWDNRCFRTIKNLGRELEPTFIGEKHVAVDDAVHQARWLQAIVKQWSLPL